jgi:hypothetical protein
MEDGRRRRRRKKGKVKENDKGHACVARCRRFVFSKMILVSDFWFLKPAILHSTHKESKKTPAPDTNTRRVHNPAVQLDWTLVVFIVSLGIVGH